VLKDECLPDFDSGDPDRLIETAHWVFGQCRAERYGLILWSHGTGWVPKEIEDVARKARGDKQVSADESSHRAGMPGSLSLFRTSLAEMLRPENPAERAILFDDGTGHALDTLQLDRVTREISDGIGQKLDLIGMDACLMATIEVAHQLRKNVAHMVASEELVPGHSWPYDTILGRLRKEPDLAARDLAELIVDQYIAYYTAHPLAFGTGDVTKIALDLSKTGTLVAAMQRLAQALETNMQQARSDLEAAQTDAYLEETYDEQRQRSKFHYHLWDILSVSNRLAVDCSVPEVKAAAGDVVKSFGQSRLVVRSGHLGEWFDGIGGLSVYWIPPKKNRPRHVARSYAQVDFAEDASWHSMLEAYRYSN
jgi:hypothetical protein